MKSKTRKLLLFVIGLFMISLMAGCKKTNDMSIKVYTRDTASGTRDGFFTGIGFKDAIKDNSVLVEGMIEVASDGDMVNAVKNDEYGIGYISLSSLSRSGLKGLVYENVEPSEENVVNGTYGLTRSFNYCKRAEYDSSVKEEIVDAFIAYMNSIEGKSTIKEHGGIVEDKETDESWNTIKERFGCDDVDNSSITIFVGGSTSVRSIVSALLLEFSAKCGNFKYSYNPTGSSDAYKRTNGSEKDSSNACDIAYASREFNSDEAMDDGLKGRMCIDAIVAVVNEKNDATKITKEELKKIFGGDITKWSELK